MDDIKFPENEDPAQPISQDEPAGSGLNPAPDGLARPRISPQDLPVGRPAPT